MRRKNRCSIFSSDDANMKRLKGMKHDWKTTRPMQISGSEIWRQQNGPSAVPEQERRGEKIMIVINHKSRGGEKSVTGYCLTDKAGSSSSTSWSFYVFLFPSPLQGKSRPKTTESGSGSRQVLTSIRSEHIQSFAQKLLRPFRPPDLSFSGSMVKDCFCPCSYLNSSC